MLEKRKIKNVNFDAAKGLVDKGKEFALGFAATPIYVFEATNEFLQANFSDAVGSDASGVGCA